MAAHKDRRPSLPAEPEAAFEAHGGVDGRAAAAAARVAARFAKAPSYNEILAGEARAAVRAAEAASKAALEAQAAAESVLAGLEAASAADPAWELTSPEGKERGTEHEAPRRAVSAERATAFAGSESAGRQAEAWDGLESFWEPETGAGQPESANAQAARALDVEEEAGSGGVEQGKPAIPIHANLIEFPREIVATRRVRPRLAEGPYVAYEGQLSIFEVDPNSISVEPAAAGAVDTAAAPSWAGPEWSGIELDAQPRPEFLEDAQSEGGAESEVPMAEAQELEERVHLAPLSRRLMAALVNGSLVMGAFLAAAMLVAGSMKALPAARVMEAGSVAALALIALLYHGLFFAFAEGTPGMRYAGVSLCTFDGRKPTRAQRLGRLIAMVLSVAPLGLGVVWAIFDEDRLSWHDRWSQTYLRKG